MPRGQDAKHLERLVHEPHRGEVGDDDGVGACIWERALANHTMERLDGGVMSVVPHGPCHGTPWRPNGNRGLHGSEGGGATHERWSRQRERGDLARWARTSGSAVSYEEVVSRE